MNIWKLSVLTMFASVIAVGCAQDVGDIDRTNDTPYFDKTDFEGVWFTRSTIIGVPGTISGVFVGVSSGMEKITWEITESSLIGYQSYEETPGFDSAAGDIDNGVTGPAQGWESGKDPGVYKGRPIVSYRITKHFDIQRGYSSSTGEQTNVISENSSDRDWHERKYFRVNWDSQSVGFKFNGDDSRWVTGADGEADGLYTERGEIGGSADALEYFDFTTKLQAAGDELTIRSSFSRLPEIERDYEPAFYDDTMMTKFGYFRTERWVYDRATGFTDSNIVYLANRHDMWKNDYKRDDAGEYLRDSRGLRIPTPMADRDPKPIVYYLNENFPEDLLTEEGVLGVVTDYNKAYTRAAAQVKGMSADEIKQNYGDMFVLCHSPVKDTDSDVCDPRSDALKEAQDNVPYVARDGDVRRSFIWWVDEYTRYGLLGYGPSYPDPETGELIAGVAYVYGAAVDSYAGSGTDIVRYANGDFTDEELREGVDKITRNLGKINSDIDPRGSLGDLSGAGLDSLLPENSKRIYDQIQRNGFEDLVAKPGRDKLIRDTIKESGLDVLMMDQEYVRGMSEGELDPTNMTDEEFEEMRNLRNPADLEQVIRSSELEKQGFAERNMYMAEFADDAVIGTALEFEGETDYEKIWKSIRARIFRGVMAHEVGHTVGLRHNFQASWDSMNFFDAYWDLRKENFKHPVLVDNFQPIYETSAVTKKQAEGKMPNYMYSSIMDYHARFNGDTSGLGKYDDAAILFAYTFGTYKDIATDNEDPILAEPGYVEVYNSVPEGNVDVPGFQPINAKDFFHSFDDRFAASQHPLTTFHYTAVVDILMGGVDNLRDRSIVRYPELLAKRAAGEDRKVEVQYMFGSDEWNGAHISVQTHDLGADALEKTRYYIQSYEEYYPLTHFRRDRANFGIGSVINRAFRSFNSMPQIYQRWLYSGQSGDQIRQFSYQLGALAGLNFLGKVIMTPEYGGYNQDGNGDYQLVTLDPEATGVDLNVGIGEGRALYSNYDQDSGYYWFSRAKEVGNFWDTRIAMIVLASNSSTQVLGSSTGDFRTYSLPYSLVFGDQLGSFVNGLYLDDARFAPEISADKKIMAPQIVPNSFNFLTGEANPASTGKIVGRSVFSTRVNGLIAAISSFGSANYSKDYVDQARVFKLGNEEQTLPLDALCDQLGLTENCNDTSHTLEYFADPSTGVVYGAIQQNGGEAGLGAELVARAKVQVAVINSTFSNQDEKEAASRELGQIIEDIILVSDTIKIFDNVLLN